MFDPLAALGVVKPEPARAKKTSTRSKSAKVSLARAAKKGIDACYYAAGASKLTFPQAVKACGGGVKASTGKSKGKGKGKSKAKKPCKYGRRRDGRCPPKPKAR